MACSRATLWCCQDGVLPQPCTGTLHDMHPLLQHGCNRLLLHDDMCAQEHAVQELQSRLGLALEEAQEAVSMI